MKKSLTLALALATFGNLNIFAQETTKIDGVKDIMCTMQYDPVCGQKQVQCIKAPCEPINQTYGNSCQANADGAKILYNGECKIQNQLEGNSYKLVFFNDKKVEGNYSLNFKDGKLGAKICNSMGGEYSLDGDKILAENIISTLMYCEGEAGEIETAFKPHNSTYSISEGGSIFMTSVSGAKFVWEYQPKLDFNFQGDWKLTSYNGKTTNQNIVLNFGSNSISTKICNQISGTYVLKTTSPTEYNIQANLVSTKMACSGELSDIEKGFNLSNAKIFLPMDSSNHFRLDTDGNYYEFERVEKLPSAYPIPKTSNGYIDFRVNKLLENLFQYKSNNNLTNQQLIDIVKSGIDKIHQIQILSLMTPMQNAKMELRKKVYQQTIQNLQSQ